MRIGWHRIYACPGRFSSTLLSLTPFVAACLAAGGAPDTRGVQRAAHWAWTGRLVVDTDPQVTVVRLRVDSLGDSERHDVVLARFDFDPAAGDGDEYALSLGLDLGRARELAVNTPLPLGVPGGIPAHATVTCLCTPLRPDSVRGVLVLRQRGLRQLTMRVDARLHFTAWGDSTRRAVYELRQALYGVH
jgi:hypothetical protein